METSTLCGSTKHHTRLGMLNEVFSNFVLVILIRFRMQEILYLFVKVQKGLIVDDAYSRSPPWQHAMLPAACRLNLVGRGGVGGTAVVIQ